MIADYLTTGATTGLGAEGDGYGGVVGDGDAGDGVAEEGLFFGEGEGVPFVEEAGDVAFAGALAFVGVDVLVEAALGGFNGVFGGEAVGGGGDAELVHAFAGDAGARGGVDVAFEAAVDGLEAGAEAVDMGLLLGEDGAVIASEGEGAAAGEERGEDLVDAALEVVGALGVVAADALVGA